MKKLISLGSVAVVLMMTFGAVSSASAADEKMGSQQSKMKTCNVDAGDKKGDDRKAFMKSCLSAKPAATQQTKMASCATSNKGKKGDDYKSSMSTCLKG